MKIYLLFNYDKNIIQDKQSALAYQLGGLQRFLNNQLHYSPGLLQAVYHLQKQYPDSKNIAHYDPLVAKLENYLERSQEAFGKNRIIRRNYDTFEGLLSRFEGDPLLIDIWATWCHPCIADFKHKKNIQPFIDENKIEMLYISIDRKEWKDRWKQSIKFNELEGYHFRADKEFIMDMWSVIEGHQGAIPRYVLVDAAGEIYINEAARPSEDKKLAKQIEKLLAEQN